MLGGLGWLRIRWGQCLALWSLRDILWDNVKALALYPRLSNSRLPCFKLARHESELEMGIEELLRGDRLALETRYIEATIAAHIRFFPCAELLG